MHEIHIFISNSLFFHRYCHFPFVWFNTNYCTIFSDYECTEFLPLIGNSPAHLLDKISVSFFPGNSFEYIILTSNQQRDSTPRYPPGSTEHTCVVVCVIVSPLMVRMI